jgi:hypothetical protein
MCLPTDMGDGIRTGNIPDFCLVRTRELFKSPDIVLAVLAGALQR